MSDQPTQAGTSVKVDPDDGAIVSVWHGLNREDVAVTCEGPEGREVGYLQAVAVSTDEVEVAIVPGTVTQIRVDPPE